MPPALPPGPSVPQLAGWSLPSDAASRDATEAKCNERSVAMTDKGEAPNLPRPATVIATCRSRPPACQPTDRNRAHQLIFSTTA
ncbi:xanthomonadin biosynthesis protein [Xanthomonas campestris pv. vitistrifoliae]|nr:xanthomonadin biosynthesis protein [Xanthomonas campestris pv. vitistrifoliae]OOW95055.1 xanthomonadin biosynthesis protein [Xanthomonas campestris pv. vitiscarnosae]